MLALCALVGAAVLADRRAAAPAGETPADHNHTPRLVPAAVLSAPPLPRTGWTVTADSQETVAENGAAANVLDGNANTIWHTKYNGGVAALPHTLTIDMKASQTIGGLTYLPRPAATGGNGRVGQYRIEVSTDGTSWSAPVATGTFADDAPLKTVVFQTMAARYLRLVALTEAGGRGQWTTAAEINVLSGVDPPLPRTGWTVAADSEETVGENGRASNVLDGNTATLWHTRYTGGATALPHTLTIDMHGTRLVSALSYLPRQDGCCNGNIGQYRIQTSTDGVSWSANVATGTFPDTIAAAKTVTFAPAVARYVRLTAVTEAGNRGPWSTASEINLHGQPDPTLVRTGWTVTADSQETVGENGAVANVLDGSATTIWHTRYSGTVAPLPHTVTIDMKSSRSVGGLSYLPRPEAGGNGRIGQFRVEVSANGTTWNGVGATGTWADNNALKTTVFPAVSARYVRLTALSEAGNRGPWTTAAEVNVLGPSNPPDSSKGTWGAPIGFPIVPVAAALLPNGKVVTWSSYAPDTFGGSGKTLTATVDPATRAVTQRTVTETGHDMFCPGISILPDGRIMVTGGDDAGKTSFYNPSNDAWQTGPQMTIPRGYQASTTLSDGRVFVIGGSWSGGQGGKNGEVWSSSGGWRQLTGAPVAPMVTGDAGGIYRADNHAWLFAWSNGTVLQAGPSKAMNWYSTSGNGSTTPAGTRGTADAMTGNAVMYDAGKILTLGGSPSYQDSAATTKAHVITLTGTTASVREVGSLAYGRAFVNSVVLPDGKVAVFGGENWPVPFSDNTAVMNAELWDPATESFTTMAAAAVPRTYHSVALLLPDGRVFTGGGGLCGAGCANNHFDGEIFTPPNLLKADGTPAPRPTITAAPSTAANGATITVTTDRAVTGFSIVRFGSATHNLNTDQRRIALAPTEVPGGYTMTIPADPGVALPGYYMLFALDAQGVPSVAKIIRLG